MKKVGRFILFLIFINIIIMTPGIIALFNSSDGKTWGEGTPDQLKKISADGLIKNKLYIDSYWSKLDLKEKDIFIQKELKRIIGRDIGRDIIVENLGIVESYQKGVLKDKNGAIFDINNLPSGLIKISYDKDKGFIYDFGGGNIIEIKKGTLDKNKQISIGGGILGFGKDVNNGIKYESGKVSFDGEKFYFYDDKSKIIFNGKIINKGDDGDNTGFVQIIDKDIIYGSNIKINYPNNVIFNLPLKSSFVIFKEGDFSKDNTYSGKYFQIYANNLIAQGEGSVHTLKNFDLISISGTEDKGITIYNGESKDYPIEFKGKKINIPTEIKEAPYDIKIIDNQQNNRVYSLLIKDGIKVLSDEKKTTMIGKLIINYLGISQNSELGAAFIGSLKVSQIDFENIPKGKTEQEYYKWIARLDQKSLETTINIPITKEMIETLRDLKISSTIGNENYEMLKTLFSLAKTAGVIPEIDSTKIEKKVDNIRSTTRVLNLGAGIAERLGIIDKKYADFAEKAAVAPDLGLAGKKFSDGVEQLFNTYDNKIPSGTKFNLYVTGDNARVKMIPPDVKMKPVEFTMDRRAANYLVSQILPKYPILSGWDEYKKNK